jgi:hypothetical protein
VPIVLKSGILNLLEPSGPVQACNGIDLPFTFYCTMCIACDPTVAAGGTVYNAMLIYNRARTAGGCCI